jgi:predicted double-glycine peptidase
MPRNALRGLVGWLCLCGLVFAADVSGIWLDIPFVKQEKNGCGAASVAMVMQYWLKHSALSPHLDADAADIQRALYSRKAKGIYASDIERYFREQGFRSFAFQGGWEDLRQHLEKGRPLIVALKPSRNAPLHYTVVAGLDSTQGVVLLNDPAVRKLLKEDRSGFEKAWNAAGNWTLLAIPQATR